MSPGGREARPYIVILTPGVGAGFIPARLPLSRRLPVIREGEPAPNFTLPAVEGGRVSLRDFQGRAVLLIFLRHLG